MCICAYFHTLFRWRPSCAFDRWGGGWTWDWQWLWFGLQINSAKTLSG